PMNAFAQRTLGYVHMMKNDHERAAEELQKALELDPLQGQFAYYAATELLQLPDKQSAALFYFARAAVYDGANAMPEPQRRAAVDSLRRAYVAYHGSDEGLDDLLAMAGALPLPPVDFSIRSRDEITANAR